MFSNIKTFQCNAYKYFRQGPYPKWSLGYTFEVNEIGNCIRVSCNIYDDETDYYVKLSLFCCHETKTVYIMDAFGFDADEGHDITEYGIGDIVDMEYYFLIYSFITEKLYENWILKIYNEDEFIVHQMSRRIIEHVVNREKIDYIASLLPFDILHIIGKNMGGNDDIELPCPTNYVIDKMNSTFFQDYKMFEKLV